jgi:hypothetical protein
MRKREDELGYRAEKKKKRIARGGAFIDVSIVILLSQGAAAFSWEFDHLSHFKGEFRWAILMDVFSKLRQKLQSLSLRKSLLI